MHENTEPFIFQKALAGITHRMLNHRLSTQAEWSGCLKRHCVCLSVVHAKPCKCVRFGLETKCPRDMVRVQIMTHCTKTGHATKSAFELFSLSFLAISLIFLQFCFLNFPERYINILINVAWASKAGRLGDMGRMCEGFIHFSRK